ncbi:MAG: hypothetical protein JWP74_3856 [Marmoricola sp.]|nr:hypothetical protein [Marmoricola sp.]
MSGPASVVVHPVPYPQWGPVRRVWRSDHDWQEHAENRPMWRSRVRIVGIWYKAGRRPSVCCGERSISVRDLRLVVARIRRNLWKV